MLFAYTNFKLAIALLRRKGFVEPSYIKNLWMGSRMSLFERKKSDMVTHAAFFFNCELNFEAIRPFSFS